MYRSYECFADSVSSWVVLAVIMILLRQRSKEELQYKKACEEYIAKIQKKQRKIAHKNKFIATLTHEMRNVVTR